MKYILNGEESERLYFRLLEEEDYESWLPLFSTREAEEFLGMASLASPEDRCRTWFEFTLARYNEDRGGMNVLIDKQSGKLIGQCGLLVQEVDEMRELEIGYSILPEFWNLGYATEAAMLCKEYAFRNKFSESLISIVHVDNIRSERVARKNGMHLDKNTVFKEMPVNIFRVSN